MARPLTGPISPPRSAAVAVLLASLLVALALTPAPAEAVAAVATARPSDARRDASPVKVQHVSVDWAGATKRKNLVARAVVPGIGNLALICRPDATQIRLAATDTSAETQLWMAKYETKDGEDSVAVKTARIYRYSQAADDGTGGTGRTTTEGLNQQPRIEDNGSGYLDGIISQRPGRNVVGTVTTGRPATSVHLTWWWAGFRGPRAGRSCHLDAVLTTALDDRIGTTWRGDPGLTVAPAPNVYAVPGFGSLVLRCDPGLGGAGQQSIALSTQDKDMSVWAEYVTGEGAVDDHVETFSLERDPDTGLIGPLDLPENGMMRLFFSSNGRTRNLVISSYYIVNDALRPDLDLCETAVARF